MFTVRAQSRSTVADKGDTATVRAVWTDLRVGGGDDFRHATALRETGKFRHSRVTLTLVLGLFLSCSAPVAAEFLDAPTIVERLKPSEGQKTRSLMVVPTEPPKVNLDVKFDLDSARLTEAAVRQLNALGSALSSPSLGPFRFEIAGHTDAHGSAAYNQTLSEQRSAAVKHYLVDTFAIDPGRLLTVGWGFHKLQDPQNPWNPDNRRVEVTNLGAQ